MTALPLPYFSGIPSSIEVSPVSNPLSSDVSTLETINLMVKYAKEGAKNPIVIDAVDQALRYCDTGSSYQDRANAIYNWIKARVSFTTDESVLANQLGMETDKELLIRPERLVTMDHPQGDCDDFSMLGASMMLVAGLPVSYVTIAADQSRPTSFSHVFCETYNEEGNKIAFDSSHGNRLGWQTDKQFRRVEWPVYMPLKVAQKAMGDLSIMKLSPEDKSVFSGRRGMSGIGTLGTDGDLIYTDAGYTVIDPGPDYSSSGSSPNYMDAINNAISASAKILGTRYSVPQLNPGQYIQNAQGTMYQLAPGQSSVGLPSLTSNSMLLVGAAILGAVLIFSRK